jgi:hypothetical protein
MRRESLFTLHPLMDNGQHDLKLAAQHRHHPMSAYTANAVCCSIKKTLRSDSGGVAPTSKNISLTQPR